MSVLRQLQPRGMAFDLRRSLLSSVSPTRSALMGYLTGNHFGAITCIHKNADESGEGVAQVLPRRDRRSWDLIFLAPALDEHGSAPAVWLELLSYLILLGAQRDVLRIYARLAEDVEAEDILRQAGFSLVTREDIFVLSHQPAPAPLPHGLRKVEAADHEALDRFRCQVMPPLVQKAKDPGCDTSISPADPFQALAIDEYVWTRRGEIIAWLRSSSGARGHWLDMVVRPDCRAEALPYIRYMLTLVDVSKQRPLYCSVPDYCVGLGWLLRTLEFTGLTRQALLVAHTVARVSVRRPLLIPGLERGVDVGPSVAPIHSDKAHPKVRLTA